MIVLICLLYSDGNVLCVGLCIDNIRALVYYRPTSYPYHVSERVNRRAELARVGEGEAPYHGSKSRQP